MLYLIMRHIYGNVDKKFQPSIFHRSRENFRHIQSDISNYRVVEVLKKIIREGVCGRWTL